MSPFLLALLVELGLISWGDISGRRVPGHTVNGLPVPADYVAPVLVFGTLGLIAGASDGARKVSTLVAWGFVVATALTGGIPSNLGKSTLQNAPGSPQATAGVSGTGKAAPAPGTLA